MPKQATFKGLGVFTFLASFIISLKVIPLYMDVPPLPVKEVPEHQVKINDPLIEKGPLKAKAATSSIKSTPPSKSATTPQALKQDKSNLSPDTNQANTRLTTKSQIITPVTKKLPQKSHPVHSGPPQVLIYHTHNRESWLPELEGKKNPSQAFDAKVNVTLLGKDLASKLTAKGMNVIQSTEDYAGEIQNFNYAKSYVYSKATLTQELSNHKSIEYVFDIHRDSESRNRTTIQFNNVDYSQLYFVVGRDNPNWEKTMQFATRVQNKLNKKIPGISKGIYQKDHSSGNGKYNQSFVESSALIEIGGVENMLRENYRTISILADVIHEIWHEDHGSTVS